MTPDSLPTLAALAVDCAVRLGVTHWVIAPGSRSAPLTAALAARDDVQRFVVYDERSAGYIALGLAQQLRTPVGLVCTSGTAAVNFGPAVVEAFYQGIPLLVLTADRPPEWIDQEDNQAIRQSGLYGAHVKRSLTLPLDDGHPDTRWAAARVVADAIQVAAALPHGPVHVNAPLREPLYAPAPIPILRPARLAQALPVAPSLAEDAWGPLLEAWRAASRKLIVGGLHPADARMTHALDLLAADPSVAILGDVTSNVHGVAAAVRLWELALMGRVAPDELAPDLVITFGGPVTARALKALLRTTAPPLWRVAPQLPAPDTFQTLAQVLPMAAPDFFADLAARAGTGSPRSDYGARWAQAGATAEERWRAFAGALPFGELAAVEAVLSALPPESALQVGNSMPIRYVNLVGVKQNHLPAQVNANRGTSGIDGTVSTAVGAALARPDRLTTLIVGDLGFFYDRNGLWHRHLPPNLRIVLLNNHGGGIFDLIDGPGALPEALRRDYFLTPQPLTARLASQEFGLEYRHACDAAGLEAALACFWEERSGPALLEVESSMAENGAIWRALRGA